VSNSASIRKATPNDLTEIERLLEEAAARGHDQELPVRQLGRHHLLVVDAPDGQGLAAAALLVIQRARGQLVMHVVDKRYEASGLSQRLVAVAEALCRAFGARVLDVASAAPRAA
jgi:N-acetylglutamate synthase-like GNAT family acetyltransferase